MQTLFLFLFFNCVLYFPITHTFIMISYVLRMLLLNKTLITIDWSNAQINEFNLNSIALIMLVDPILMFVFVYFYFVFTSKNSHKIEVRISVCVFALTRKYKR